MKRKLLFVLVVLVLLVEQSSQHGSLVEPPSRSYAWRVDKDFKQCCTSYDDNELNCGGTHRLWNKNGGQCGVCGESFDKPQQYMKGGSKYLGKIVRTYTAGSEIDIEIKLTANHKGVFEFRICNLDSMDGKDATQECLNNTMLSIAGTTDTRYVLDNQMTHKYAIQLPKDLTCSHCVLQWKWIAKKDWGTDENGRGCMGCGLIQETTYNCADISIAGSKAKGETTAQRTTSSTSHAKLSSRFERTTTEPEAELVTEQELSRSEVLEGFMTKDTCQTTLQFGKKLNFSKMMTMYCENFCNSRCIGLMKTLEENLINGVPTEPTSDLLACLDTCPIICKCFKAIR